jgi:hypothetical protein
MVVLSVLPQNNRNRWSLGLALPDKLAQCVVCFLSAVDLVHLAAVSPSCASTYDSDTAWAIVFLRDFPRAVAMTAAALEIDNAGEIELTEDGITSPNLLAEFHEPDGGRGGDGGDGRLGPDLEHGDVRRAPSKDNYVDLYRSPIRRLEVVLASRSRVAPQQFMKDLAGVLGNALVGGRLLRFPRTLALIKEERDVVVQSFAIQRNMRFIPRYVVVGLAYMAHRWLAGHPLSLAGLVGKFDPLRVLPPTTGGDTPLRGVVLLRIVLVTVAAAVTSGARASEFSEGGLPSGKAVLLAIANAQIDNASAEILYRCMLPYVIHVVLFAGQDIWRYTCIVIVRPCAAALFATMFVRLFVRARRLGRRVGVGRMTRLHLTPAGHAMSSLIILGATSISAYLHVTRYGAWGIPAVVVTASSAWMLTRFTHTSSLFIPRDGHDADNHRVLRGPVALAAFLLFGATSAVIYLEHPLDHVTKWLDLITSFGYGLLSRVAPATNANATMNNTSGMGGGFFGFKAGMLRGWLPPLSATSMIPAMVMSNVMYTRWSTKGIVDRGARQRRYPRDSEVPADLARQAAHMTNERSTPPQERPTLSHALLPVYGWAPTLLSGRLLTSVYGWALGITSAAMFIGAGAPQGLWWCFIHHCVSTTVTIARVKLAEAYRG